MKKLVQVLSMALLPFIGFAEYAMEEEVEGHIYYGVQYGQASLKSDFAESNHDTPMLRLGYMHDNFGFEARVMLNVSKDENPSDTGHAVGTAEEVSLQSLYGLYMVGQYPVTSEVAVYGLAGLSSIDSQASIPGAVGVINISAVSAGAGLEYNIGEYGAVSLEYMDYTFNATDLDLTAVNLGYRYISD